MIRDELMKKMTERMRDRFEKWWTQGDKLLAYTGGLINWVGDYLTDENIIWSKVTLPIDMIKLTGTNPEFNKIIVDECQKDPRKFRERLAKDENVRVLFANIEYDMTGPILVRREKDEYLVLDGMYEMIAANRDGLTEIEVYVATPKENAHPLPHCEPHVIYDIIRPCLRGYNRDIEGMTAALRFIKNSYGNGEKLVRERFNEQWVLNDPQISEAIRELLTEK